MRIIQIIKRYIRSPRKLIRTLGEYGVFNWLPDRPYLRLVYWAEMGKRLNLDPPVTYNEKLQWLKIYDRKPEYTKYVDKYAVRSHVRATIGEQYLIPLLGLYNSVEEINWAMLPKQFVLKCTHGSGSNIICKEKDKLDIQGSKMKVNKWMKKSWFWFGREWPYRNVKPRIICEEFLSNHGEVPDDYKVLCFNGKAKLIEVHTGRYENHRQDFYDINWNKTEISQAAFTRISNKIIKKPQVLEEMLQLSEKLSQNTYHVRIDWYVVEKRLYFGEITFFDSSGFCPFDTEDFDLLLGRWINLSNCS